MQLPPKNAAGEFDYTPPQAIVNPDGSVEVWDASSHSYVTHYPQQDKATPDWSRATGGDNSMFDPASMTERPSNPIQTFGDPDADNHDAVRLGADSPIMDHMVECTRCGTPTAEAQCPRCGQELTHQWEYAQPKHDPSPFNDNVPKEDYHHYDMMVPWGSGGGGALSHATGAVNSERTSMDDRTLSALNRLSVGKADVDLNDCPECSQPMVKRAGEGYEFCPSCGHKNKVIDTVVSNQWNAANPELDYKEFFQGQGGNPGMQGMPQGVMCPQCHNEATYMGHDATGNDTFHCNHCGNRFQNQAGATKLTTHEAGFLDEVKNLGSDTASLGKDFYHGDVGNMGGDVLNMGADVGKGVAYGAKDHPLIAASLAAPFALPFLGAGALALGGSELAGSGLAADALTGVGTRLVGDAAAGGIGTGEQMALGDTGQMGLKDLAQQGVKNYGNLIPDRAKNLLGGAVKPGIAFSGGQALGRQQSGGGLAGPTGMPGGEMGGAYASTQPNGGRVLTFEEMKQRRAWTEHYDLFSHLAADDDQSSDLSTRTDGLNITDPMTQGSQEETGDSLDELLKSLGDDGSANKDAYTPEQSHALEMFNHNLPIILDFNTREESGADHPIIKSVIELLHKAFGESPVGGSETTDEKSDASDTTEHKPEEKHEKKQSAMPVQTPQQAPGAMQPQQQTSVTPCAICGGPHPTDQHPSAVNPPTQGGQFGMASKVQLLEHISGRKPKMCPYHSELVDFSLTTGDPFQARQAVRPSDYGERGTCGKSGGAFEGGCNFKPAMVTQDFWDQRDQASQERRDQRQLEMQQTQQHEQAPPSESFENAGEQEPVAETGYAPHRNELETAVGVGTMNDPAGEALQMAAKMLREAKIVPQGWKLKMEIVKTAGPEHDHVQPTQHGEMNHAKPDVQVGQTYLLHSNQYDVPDHVKVQQVKPNGSVVVTFLFEGGMESQPKELTPEMFQAEGLSFKPVDFTNKEVEPGVLDQPQAQQPDTAPDVNETTDLSASHTGEAEHEDIDDHFIDGLAFTDEAGEPVDYATYAAKRREVCPPDMQWLWDDVEKENKISRRQKEMNMVIAGRQFSQREQSDLINEKGTARNSDKFDLRNTHYDSIGETDAPDEHFLWGE